MPQKIADALGGPAHGFTPDTFIESMINTVRGPTLTLTPTLALTLTLAHHRHIV